MHRTMTLIAGTALLLAGCDGGTTGGNPTPTGTVKVANPYVDRLRTLEEIDRGLWLRRGIIDSNFKCKKVSASGYQEDYKNLSMWTVRCTDSGDWAVYVAATGDVQARRCDEAAQLGLPQCRMPPSGS